MRRRIASPDWADNIFSAPRTLGPEYDALAPTRPLAEWPAPERELLFALSAIKPRQKLAVLATVRNEAAHLPEWFAHHLAIGVQRFFIYSNDNTDGTAEMLRWFAANAPVHVTFMQSSPGVNIQHKHYRHALLLCPELRLYEWTAVIDADEFLLPDARYNHHLPTLLAAAPPEAEVILFPWHWRLWTPHFERQPGLLAENHPHAVPSVSTKAVTRLRHVQSLHQVHFPEFFVPHDLYDSALQRIEQGANWHLAPKTGAGGWTEHFWTTSFEDYLIKQARSPAFNLPEGSAIRSSDAYFNWTQPETDDNAAPFPPTLLEATKAQLAKFAAKPGYANMQALVATRAADYAVQMRSNPALCALYAAKGVTPP